MCVGRAVGVLVALAVLGGCDTESSTDAAGDEPVATTVPVTGPVAATELAAGDCLRSLPLGANERSRIETAQLTDCASPHDLEVFATFRLHASDFERAEVGEFPGTQRIVRAADTGCGEELVDVTGDRESYGLIAVWPTSTSWAEGDREVACLAFEPNGEPFSRREFGRG